MNHKYIHRAEFAMSKIISVRMSPDGEDFYFNIEGENGVVEVKTPGNGWLDFWPLVGKYYINMPDGSTMVESEGFVKRLGFNPQ